jgi:hypothetical protein
MTAKKGIKRGKRAAKEALVTVDKKLKARWQAQLERFEENRGRELAGWDEMYEALGEILDSEPPLYLAGGFKTARAFLAARLPGVNEQTARDYVRVARNFDPPDEQKHGVSKLVLLLDYVEAVGGAPLVPVKLDPDRVQIKEGPGGPTVRFSEISYQALRVAVRAAKGRSRKPRPADPPLVRAVRAALKRERLGQLGVRQRRDKLDLTGIPKVKLAAAGRALIATKLPA